MLVFDDMIADMLTKKKIVESSYETISDFKVSDQSFIDKNCRNFRASYDIDVKLGPVIQLDKKNYKTS